MTTATLLQYQSPQSQPNVHMTALCLPPLTFTCLFVTLHLFVTLSLPPQLSHRLLSLHLLHEKCISVAELLRPRSDNSSLLIVYG